MEEILIEKEDNLSQIIQSELKRKRGRPKGSKNKKNIEPDKNYIEPEENSFEPDKNLFFPISGVFNLIFERLKWDKLSEIEKENLDNSFSKLLNKYIDKIQYVEEINFALVLLIIISDRYEFKKDKSNTWKDWDRKEFSNKEEHSKTEKEI